jgi:hypothetical protein
MVVGLIFSKLINYPMNAKYSALKNSTVKVETPSGLIEFKPLNISGGGKHKYDLFIETILPKSDISSVIEKQCHFSYNGQQFGGMFELLGIQGEFAKVKFITLVPESTFWE